MSYIRNPRLPHVWESDGDAPWGKYRAADGTMHDSTNQADKHDRDNKQHPWWPEAAPLTTAVGNVLDHWEQLPNDLRGDVGFENLESALQKLYQVVAAQDKPTP